MPAVRLSRRRRSSLQAFTPAKAGIYGISRPVTFAPNVTPVTYVEPEDSSRSASPEPGSPSLAIFPPSQTPAPPPSRRRLPPGKRRSMGYIPRPPNAFMLFRADFVRQKHVPGSIETNHGSLSKIIGNCWRSLPLEEKRVWEVKAKHAKAEHKVQYPDYRFRPVHNKNKDKKKEKPASAMEDERRCEEVAQLLLEGKKGDELAAAVRNLDRLRSETPAAVQPVYPVYQHRRSSSVPLPNDFYGHHQYSNIAIPSIPFLSTASRPPSPVRSISRQQRMMYGHRRTSSAQPNMFTRSWTYPAPLQRDPSPLPEVDTSLFEPSFMSNFSFSSQDLTNAQTAPFNINELLTSLPHEQQNAPGPLDAISPHDMISHPLYTSSSGSSQQSLPDLDSLSWLPFDTSIQSQSNSHPSTAYSGSPTPSENAPLPIVHAPKPVVADITPTSAVFADMWKMGTESYPDSQTYGLENGLNITYDQAHDLSNCGHFDNMFEPAQQYDQGYGYEFDLIAQQ